jgi:hypothetical protein
MAIANKMFLSLLVTVSVVFPGTKDSFSFSGLVLENVGCTDKVPEPIRNATVTVYDNQSCIINAMLNQSSSFVYGGRRTSYHTATSSAGSYRFENLCADTFTCYPINQMVEVEADGFYRQRRDIVPEQDSVLNFDLLETSKDSIVPVTATVVAVDTSGHYSPAPLENYRIEIPNRYLSWISSQVKDTSDKNGKATFSLSVVPYVDYRIVAKSLNGDNYSGEIISNIASCNGNNLTISVYIPRTMIGQTRIREKGSSIVEWLCTRFNSGTAITLRIPECELSREGILIKMFDVKGKSVGSFKKNAGLNAADRSVFFTVTTGELPVGMYLLKVKLNKRSYSGKILIGR